MRVVGSHIFESQASPWRASATSALGARRPSWRALVNSSTSLYADECVNFR